MLENIQPFPRECEEFLSGLELNKVLVKEDAFNCGRRLGMDLMPDHFAGSVDLDLPISSIRAIEEMGPKLEPNAHEP